MLVNGILRGYTTETEYIIERYKDGEWVEVIRNQIEASDVSDSNRGLTIKQLEAWCNP